MSIYGSASVVFAATAYILIFFSSSNRLQPHFHPTQPASSTQHTTAQFNPYLQNTASLIVLLPFIPSPISGSGTTYIPRDPSPLTAAKPHSFFFPRSALRREFFPLSSPQMEPQTPNMDDEKAKVKKKGATHRKSLSCEYCSRSFARLEHLQRHLRTR